MLQGRDLLFEKFGVRLPADGDAEFLTTAYFRWFFAPGLAWVANFGTFCETVKEKEEERTKTILHP